MLGPGDADAIAALYGLGDDAVLSGPVARGEVGQVWRLTSPGGAWAVKEPFERPSATEVDDDTNFQEAVFAAGVCMPRPVRALTGEVFADPGSTCVRLYEWVELLTRDPRLDPATVGRIVASIHRVQFAGSNPVDPWYTDPVGAEAWDDLIARLRSAAAPFAEQLAEMRDELVALERLIEWPRQLQTCHRDLFADNVLQTPSGEPCVIDWENAGLADPTQELGLVLFEFSCGDMTRARTLYDSYREAGGPGRIDRPSNFSMVLCQLAHIGAVACTRWLDAARRADRQHNQDWAMEFITQPLTRQMIDEFVDTLAS